MLRVPMSVRPKRLALVVSCLDTVYLCETLWTGPWCLALTLRRAQAPKAAADVASPRLEPR